MGDETVRAIAARHGINANQLSKWKTQAHDGLLDVFDNAAGNPASRETDKLIEQLYARIGELVVERDFFFEGFRALERDRKVTFILDDGTLPLTRKCELAGVSRASLYYRPRPVDALTLELQLVVDKLYMECPYYGSRRVMFHLRREGYAVGRTKARSLMAAVGWRTVHPGPRTTKPQPGHKIYPLFAEGSGGNPPWRGDLRRHHLHSGAGRFLLLGRPHGLGQPLRVAMGVGQHDGGGFLRERRRGGVAPIRRAVDLEHRPGQPVHQRRLHPAAARGGGANQHGRQGAVDGQSLHRATLAVAEVRGGLP